jgi:hypothetical protein
MARASQTTDQRKEKITHEELGPGRHLILEKLGPITYVDGQGEAVYINLTNARRRETMKEM